MNIRVSLFLAWRYFIGSHENTSIKTMMRICFLSIFIASCSLTLIMGIMHGFKNVTYKKLQSIYPSIVITTPQNQSLDYEKINDYLLQKYSKQCIGITQSALHNVLIQSPIQEIPSAALLKAINPINESTVTPLQDKIFPQKSLSELLTHDRIIIGKNLAQHLDVIQESPCTILFAEDEQMIKNKLAFSSIKVRVGGILHTGIAEYDDNIIIMSLETLKNITGSSTITNIGIKTHENTNNTKLAQQLRTELELPIHSWEESYPTLVSAIQFEEYSMILILILIMIIASINCIALIFMQITRKRSEIAILKILGLDHISICITFIIMSIFLTSIATISGIVCSIFLGYIQNTYHIITLPDIYYASHLPIAITTSICISIFSGTLLFTFIATLLPINSIKTIHIAEIIKFEQ